MKVHWSLWVALAVLVLIVVFLSARREGYAPPRDENTLPPYTNDISNTVTTSNNLPYVDSTSSVVRVDNQSQIYKDMGGMDFQLQAGNPILNFIQGDPSSNVMYGDFVAHQSDGGSAQMYAYLGDLEMIEEGDTVSNTSKLVAVPENPTMMETVYGVDVNGNLINPTMMETVYGVDVNGNLINPTMMETVYGVDVNGNLINPTMMETVYGVDVNGNLINPTEVETTANALFDLRYGFEENEKATTNPNDNAQIYGFNAEGNFIGVDVKGSPIMPDAGQYIPALTSPTIPFLGDQPGIRASESPESVTSPVEAQ
jgi:hypothetical protein